MLKEHERKTEIEERVDELVDAEASNLWNSFKDGVLKACDKVCERKMVKMDRNNMCWWHKGAKDPIAGKKAFKRLCKILSKENMIRYRKMRNQTRIMIARAMKKEVKRQMGILCENRNIVFKIRKLLKKRLKICGRWKMFKRK